MIVNPDVDIYTKTWNQRNILRKTQKITYWKPKEYQIPVFAFSLPGGGSLPSPIAYSTVRSLSFLKISTTTTFDLKTEIGHEMR